MNTLNNYISEKLFVDTEEEISSAIDQPMIIKTLESVLSNVYHKIEINDKNEIIIKNDTLNLNKRILKILNDAFKNTSYRIKYCHNISFDIYDNIDNLPQWINDIEVENLEFLIHKSNLVLQNMSFNLTNKYMGSSFSPKITFEMINNISTPDTKNVIFNNISKKTSLFIGLRYGGFKFDDLNYNFFKGIDIKGKKLENISLSYLKYSLKNRQITVKDIETEVKNNKELYDFYKKYSDHLELKYRIGSNPIFTLNL